MKATLTHSHPSATATTKVWDNVDMHKLNKIQDALGDTLKDLRQAASDKHAGKHANVVNKSNGTMEVSFSVVGDSGQPFSDQSGKSYNVGDGSYAFAKGLLDQRINKL